MDQETFIKNIIKIAKRHGYQVKESRNGLQIDFGNKKLHEGHLGHLYPDILQPDANIKELIDDVAPGRPCSHKPMREIIAELLTTNNT